MKDFEINIIKTLRDISSPSLDIIFRCLTFMGEQVILILLIAIVYFLMDKKEGQKIGFALVSTLLLNNSLKGVIKYERPFVYSSDYKPADIAIESATGYSFPSGHTQNATTLYTSLALTFKKQWLTITCISLIIIVGFSRIYLGVHFPKDVVFGVIFGVGCTLLTRFLYNKYATSLKNELIIYGSTLLIFIPFLFVFWTKDYNKLLLVRDFYIAFAFALGFFLAIIFEKKLLDFEKSNNFKTNVYRFIGAIISLLIFYIGLKLLFKLPFFPQEGNVFKVIFDCIRYFLVSFVSLGVYPVLFKNILFKKEA